MQNTGVISCKKQEDDANKRVLFCVLVEEAWDGAPIQPEITFMLLFTLMREDIVGFLMIRFHFSFTVNADLLWQKTTLIKAEVIQLLLSHFLAEKKKHPAELNPLLKQLFKGLRFDIQQPRRIKKAYSIYPFISPKTAAIHFCTSTLTFLIVFVFLPHFTRTHRVLSGGPKTM